MSSRFSPFVATALALHVGLFVWAHFAPSRRAPVGPRVAEELTTEVWISEPELIPPEAQDPTPAAQDPAPAHAALTEAVARAIRVPTTPEVLRANPAAEPGTESSWSMPAIATKPVDIGLDRNAFAQGLIPMPPAALAAPAPRPEAPPPPPRASRTGGLSEGLAAQDLQRGLSRGGPVVTAAHDAVSTSLIPNDCTATIEIRFDGSGHPVDARVISATGAEREWTEAARTIVANLKSRPVRVPENAAGLSVQVHIEVALKLPSGSSGVKPTGLGLAGDLSDIGQRSRRTVAARIVSERLL